MTEKEVWNTKEIVNHHMKFNDILIPGRSETLFIIARLATVFASIQPKVIDLGCGYGDVTDAVFELKPLASVSMIDYSEEMLRLARERFGNNDRVEIIKHDLNDGIPNKLRSGKFDAVVSCHALHHVEYENRVGLYAQIKQTLVEGGLFINGDRFTGESPVISGWEFDNWIAWMTAQIKGRLGKDKSFEKVKKTQLESDKKLGDKPGTLWDMQRDLRQAGFKYVDCVWKNHNMGILVAGK